VRTNTVLGEEVRGIIGIAASPRPCDIVEDDEGETRAIATSDDRGELSGNGVVVVITVDDVGVTRLDVTQTFGAAAADQLNRREPRQDVEQRRRRFGFHRVDSGGARLGPLPQDGSERARVGTDLHDGVHAADVEALENELVKIGERRKDRDLSI
jgi:hypothetical protein